MKKIISDSCTILTNERYVPKNKTITFKVMTHDIEKLINRFNEELDSSDELEFMGVEYCKMKLPKTKNKEKQLLYLITLEMKDAITVQHKKKLAELKNKIPDWKNIYFECLNNEECEKSLSEDKFDCDLYHYMNHHKI